MINEAMALQASMGLVVLVMGDLGHCCGAAVADGWLYAMTFVFGMRVQSGCRCGSGMLLT
jgi:hypothetical protein